MLTELVDSIGLMIVWTNYVLQQDLLQNLDKIVLTPVNLL